MCAWRSHHPPRLPPGAASKRLPSEEKWWMLSRLHSCKRAAQDKMPLSVLSNAQVYEAFAMLAPVMAIRNRWRQGQGHPEGSEEGTPTAPQTKGEGQQAARLRDTAGTSTAQGLQQDGLEQRGVKDRLRVQVVRSSSSRTSSPKTPSPCPLR